MINNESSSLKPVISGIPQGSVLGPILFLIYINDIADGIDSCIKIFADDTKIFRALEIPDDRDLLQSDIDRLLHWSQRWQLPFNISKCKVIHYGTRNVNYTYTMEDAEVEVDDMEKDLGISFDRALKFSPHVRAIVAKANSRVGILRRNFSNLSPTVFLPLYKALIRPLLEYGSVIWNPLFVMDIQEIEKVQRRATKLVKSISHLPYEDRLRLLKLDSLKYRRRRNDMIQVFRIFKGLDRIEATSMFTRSHNTITRGHSYKIAKIRAKSCQRQNSFTMRIVNDWNNLKETTVTSPSLNAFKTALQIEWLDHPDKYDVF